jgi:hypothetical protein
VVAYHNGRHSLHSLSSSLHLRVVGTCTCVVRLSKKARTWLAPRSSVREIKSKKLIASCIIPMWEAMIVDPEIITHKVE